MRENMRYAFYVSGSSRRLIKFLNQADKNIISQVKVIISDLTINQKLRELIEDLEIKSVEFNYKNLPGESKTEKNLFLSDNMLNILQEEAIDYCISFGSHILSGRLLEEYNFRIINFHPAILPMFPGVKAIDQAIEHGNVLLVGNTAHFIDSGVDTGPIIMQSVTTMHNFAQNRDYDTILDLQIPMLNSILTAINNGDLKVIDGRVLIHNADYAISYTFPEYS